uniref:OV-17 antigen n=2 Tax=Onchocerca TaxID=6281 RepID=OV17_ONCVO|nr:RecName: Full=OV-17 antigen; AltName: Full=Immunodominant hypodermal antigen; Flags: Precursor [Onchocerca volvulus]AAA18283.1 immunodominant hypodermal antigen [Onchocerca volvulus]
MKFVILLTIGLLVVAAIPQRRQQQQQQQQQQQRDEREIPPFLEGAPPSVIDEFYNLLKTDENKTDQQTEADVEAFINRLGGSYKVRFTQFMEEVKKARADYERIHQQAVARFSPAAKDADARMSAIADSPHLTTRQKSQQIQAIMDSLSESVRREIINALSPQE